MVRAVPDMDAEVQSAYAYAAGGSIVAIGSIVANVC